LELSVPERSSSTAALAEDFLLNSTASRLTRQEPTIEKALGSTERFFFFHRAKVELEERQVLAITIALRDFYWQVLADQRMLFSIAVGMIRDEVEISELMS
jgi:hypothetical protein